MTRFPRATSADGKATTMIRLALGENEDLVVEMSDRSLSIRPKHSRDPSACVSLTWSGIYRHALLSRAEDLRRLKRQGRTK